MAMQPGNMTVRGRACLWAAAVFALLAAGSTRAQAQDYDTSIGWGGGYLKFAPFVEQGASAPSDLGLGGTWVAVLQAESWKLNRWLGLRLGGFYSHGNVAYPTAEKDVSAYGAEAAVLLRIVPPAPQRTVSAYVLAGGGLTYFALGEGGGTVPIAGTNVLYDEGDARQWMGVAGGGLEFLTGITVYDGLIGVRAEAVDMMALSRPLREIGGGDPDPMHNLRFSVTVFSGVPKLF